MMKEQESWVTDDKGAVIMTADGNSGDPKLGRENLKKVKWSDRGLIHKLALNGKYYYYIALIHAPLTWGSPCSRQPMF